MTIFYMICLIITVGNLVYLSQKKYKITDRYLWTILLLMPVVILGYWMKSTVHTADAATLAFCFIYLDSTVLPVVLIFSMLNSMEIKVSPWVKLSAYGITSLHLLTIWISRDNTLYYDTVTLTETMYGTSTRMTSGPLKITHYIFLLVLLLAFLVTLTMGFFRKGNGSKKNQIVYSGFGIAGIIIYTAETILNADFSVLPGLYVVGSFLITLNYDITQSHNIYNLISEKQTQTSLRGFCAFDLKRRILGYNDQFAAMMPDVAKISVDRTIPKEYETFSHYMNNAMDSFEKHGEYLEKVEIGEKIYQLIVSTFSVSNENKHNGYLVEISDITDEQKRVDTIEKYNTRLNEEVSEKTNHILEIQNSVVLGLANMVENRDDNTGGHVKRTSEVIKYLVEEIQRMKTYQIDDQTAADIVRAAPMHDLGKISIETAILCKPAKLDDAEYAIMKTHAPKSGEIVKIILEGVEEQHFVDVAYNVARHHHERWDGKGYPEGLMGESIPVEARIMAVADVYDALVSKRCYKEPMSFEVAAKIMNENMGSQFDPSMRPVFVACRSKLEAYYSQNR